MANAQRVFDDQVRHAINLQRFNRSTIRGMLAILRDADSDLVGRIALMDGETKKGRERMLAAIRDAQKKTEALLADRLAGDVGDLAEYEVGFQRRSLGALGLGRGDFNTVSLNAVRAAALLKPFKSVHLQWAGLQDHLAELGRRRRRLIEDRIRQGFVEGESTQSIIRGLVGTRRLNYADGLLERPRREVEAVVRTSMTQAATTAREAFFEQNADIVEELRWTAVLDSRTSVICASLDGKVFKVGEGPRPPAHPNCRSIMVGLPKNEPPPAFTNYGDWLARQDAATQDEVLGKTKGKLFRDGGLPIDRFTDDRNRVLTLADLRRIESEAFDRAGL